MKKLRPPIVLEEWAVIDKWWTKEPIRISYVEVNWNGRRITFRKHSPETIWRIIKC